MGFDSINQPSWSSEVNIIQKEAFHFIGWRGVVDGVWVHWPVWPTSEVECNQKMSISFFCLETGGGWGSSPLTSPADHQKLNVIQKWAFHFYWLERGGRWGLSSLNSPTNHQKLNVTQKWAFHFLAGEEWWMRFKSIDLSGQHHMLNVIQKWAFHFFGWRGVADGVWVHWPAQPIIRSWT